MSGPPWLARLVRRHRRRQAAACGWRGREAGVHGLRITLLSLAAFVILAGAAR